MSGTADRRPAPGGAPIDSELARRLHRALTAAGPELFQLIQDPVPAVLHALLKNRSVNEEHLLALLQRRDLSEELLRAVYQREGSRQSHRLLLALAKNPGTPGPIVLTILPHLHLFELLDLCILPETTPDQRYAAERQILSRLPTIPLGNKLTLARRGTPTLVGEILKEGEAQTVSVCLDSPRLKEIAVLQFLGGARATAETLSMVARHPKWKSRPNLRTAILKNRLTPPVWFTLFLPLLRPPELHTLLASRQLTPAQKQLVQAERMKR